MSSIKLSNKVKRTVNPSKEKKNKENGSCFNRKIESRQWPATFDWNAFLPTHLGCVEMLSNSKS